MTIYAVISNYCMEAPNVSVSNSVVVGTYGTAINNTATVGCALGYVASGSTSATCTAYNDSSGQWTISLTCTCKLVVGFSFSHP